jgi:sugar lactone lactonase YvrE
VTVDVAVRAGAELGESPFWDTRESALGWIDMAAGTLWLGGQVVRRAGEKLAAAVPAASGGWVALTFSQLGLFGPHGLRSLGGNRPEGERFNDAKCDPVGRLWAGSTRPGQSAAGALLRWSAGRFENVWSGLTVPNGLGWSPDGRTFYLADSGRKVILSAPFEAETGRLGDPAALAAFTDGMPDGLCVAADGSLWIALWGAGEVLRLTPEGQVIQTVPLPVSQPSSCALGPDGTLYVTSARWGLTAPEPLAGSVFAFPAGVPPAPVGSFLNERTP